MSTVRVVRPRPLGVNDRIPVFWAGQEPSQELKAVDGGALYRHLVAVSTPTTNRKRKRTEKYHAPKEGEAHEHFSPVRRAHEQQQKGPSDPIHIPRVREVEDYALNQQAAAPFGPMISGDIAAAPYIRHKELLPGMYEEHEVPEYDADDKDMAWLHNVNTKNGQNSGIFAAAVGLYHQVAQRIARTSSDAAAASPSTPMEVRLSLETFEKAVNMLELMHFDAVKAWWEEQQSGPSTSAPEIPEIPAMKRLLPRAVALEGLSRLVPDSKLALQLLEYWLRRRQQEGGPLLARLWFEQPWKLVAFAEFVVSDDEDFDEHLPFMAVEPRSAHGKSRRGGNQRRRQISEDDALDALYGLRNELEVLRTLADQVRKREKLKRQLLLVWQQETQMRLQLGLPPTQPIPGVSRPRAGAGTSAAAAGAAAANVAAAAAAAAAGASAAAARAAAALPPPLPTGLTDVSRRLAKAAAVAAAAASPAEGSHGRQTRTAAAAAAATFEATFAAKRDMLVPLQRSAAPSKLQRASAAAEAEQQQPATAAAALPAGSRKAAGGKGGRGGPRARPASAKQQLPKRSSRAAVAAAAADAGDADDEMDVSSEEPAAAAAAASPGTTVYVDAEEVASDGEEEQESQQPPKQRRRVARSAPLPRQQQKQKQPAKGRQKAGARRATAAAADEPQAAAGAAAAAADSSPSSDDSDDADYSASEGEQEVHKPQQRRKPQQQRRPQQQQQQHKPRQAGRQVRGSKAALKRPADRRSSSMRGSSSDDGEAASGQEAWQSDEDFKQPSPRTVRYVQHLQEQEQRKQQQQQQTQKQVTQKRLAAVAASGGAAAQQLPEQQPLAKQHQGRKRNGLVSRRPSSLAAAAAIAAAAASGGSSEDSGGERGTATAATKGPRTPRRAARVLPALPAAAPAHRAAGAAAAAAAAADAADSSPAERTVLRPHNQQQRAGKQADGQKTAGVRPGSAAAKAASHAAAVRSSLGAGQAARPASGNSRGTTAGASVRRVAAAAIASAKRKRDVRRPVGQAELRSLGIVAPEPPMSPARSRRR